MKIKLKKRDNIIDTYPTDNDWNEILKATKKEISAFSCCDCGLAHRLDYKIENGKLFMRFSRDEKISKRNRKYNDYQFIKY